MIDMRRVVYTIILLIGFGVMISSCSNNDKNISVVKKEFKKYVQKTFDNPKELKEIVDIIPSDTISIEKIKTLLEQTNKMCALSIEENDIADSLSSEAMGLTQNIDRQKARSSTYSTYYRLKSSMDDLYRNNIESISLKFDMLFCQEAISSLMDSLKYEPPIYEYTINYRVNKEDKLKLESQYAYIDSLNGFKKILPYKMPNEDYSEQIQEALEAILDAQECYDELTEHTEEVKKKTDDFRKLILPVLK